MPTTTLGSGLSVSGSGGPGSGGGRRSGAFGPFNVTGDGTVKFVASLPFLLPGKDFVKSFGLDIFTNDELSLPVASMAGMPGIYVSFVALTGPLPRSFAGNRQTFLDLGRQIGDTVHYKVENVVQKSFRLPLNFRPDKTELFLAVHIYGEADSGNIEGNWWFETGTD